MSEPDMDRMSDQHIKPCKGCGVLVLWAKHVNTNKLAPLVKAKEDEKPNITAWWADGDGAIEAGWYYEIKKPDQTHDTNPPEYVSHFSNCPKAKDFHK